MTMKYKRYPKINEEVYTLTLENKLKVYYIPRTGFQNKIAIIATRFGSLHSNQTVMIDGKSKKIPFGTAHFLEHRMFSIKDKDASELFLNLGASSNAFTSYNTTAYYFKCNDRFYENLDVLFEMISSFDSTSKQIENEKQIIIEELKMYQDEPATKLLNNLFKNGYQYHLINQDIGGTIESVESIDKKMLEACYKKYYDPSNLVLVIAGDLNVDELEKYLNNLKVFDKKIDKPNIKKLSFKNEPLEVINDRTDIYQDISLPLYGILFKLKPVNTKLQQKAYLQMEILLSYYFDASGIYTEDWLKKKIINNSISFYHGMNIDLNYLILYNINDKYDISINHILDVFDKKHFTMTESDFKRIKNKLIGSLIKEYGNVEEMAKEYLHYLISDMDYFKEITILNQITLEDIYETYLEICNASHCIVIERKDAK